MCSNSKLASAFKNDFEVNQTKINGGCQSGRKVVSHDSKSYLPLACAKTVKIHIYLTLYRAILDL